MRRSLALASLLLLGCGSKPGVVGDWSDPANPGRRFAFSADGTVTGVSPMTATVDGKPAQAAAVAKMHGHYVVEGDTVRLTVDLGTEQPDGKVLGLQKGFEIEFKLSADGKTLSGGSGDLKRDP